MRFLAIAAVFLLAAFLSSQPAPPERVGPLPGGGFLLNSGWRLQPAGRQIPLDTFPMSTALSPDGRHLLILNGGYRPPSISVFDANEMREIGRVPVADAWLGLTFTANGRMVYVGGGSQAAVYEFTFSPEGKLELSRTFTVVPEAERTHRDFIGDVALSPDGRLLYAADLYHDQILVINPQSGRVIEKFPTGRRPYRILFHPDGRSFYVSCWADSSVVHLQADNGNRLGFVRVGSHPTDMVWRDKQTVMEEGAEPPWKARLFVTAGNTNSAYVIGISESKEMRVVESINLALTPQQPVGMTPSAVALNADQSNLFVVCSDANAVAVVDVAGPRSRVLGFVPTGWYPTAARVLSDGRLVVLNGRGGRSYANPNGPNPVRRPAPVHLGAPAAAVDYVGRIQTGTASLIQPPNKAELDVHTRTVLANTPYRDRKLLLAHEELNTPIPARPGEKSPIEHVIYIVKENRTYDQVLGDLGIGNGDPSLVLFGGDSSPNHRKLAREFVLLDNFYVSADVSADGHNWTTAAIAPDYVQRLWPNSYARRRRFYDYEGQDPTSIPPAGYIWTSALAARIPFRNYGYFVNNKPKAGSDGIQVESLRDPALRDVTNMSYRGFDLDYLDVERAKVFITDLVRFENSDSMPRLIAVRLGNDHTSGTAPGKVAPLSAMADNDFALGLIVEAVSRSKFWPKTAIFVLEDDAQNGADHVDSHRSPAYVISPYAKRGVVDSTMYNTTSMLRTIELILGLRPMTVFDAGARPMTGAFQPNADLKPYAAEKPRIKLDERNPVSSATAARSLAMDFSEEDRIDDDELNDILWRALRKGDPPPPVRSYFSR
jgi:YVTN family beta-propeller protein